MSLLLPNINAKGMFTFEAPFDNILINNKEYTVKAVRSLKEMDDAGERPFDNIYKEAQLDEVAYQNDLINDVPIVVLVDSSGNYVYIPGNKLKSLPKNAGVKYQEVMLGMTLGVLPITYNLENVKRILVETLKAELGITSEVRLFETSSVHFVDSEKDKEFKKTIELNKTSKENIITKYKDLLNRYNETKKKITLLENYIKYRLRPGEEPA